MSLLNPLGLLGLLGIPIIILIYLLKSRYVTKPVSSTFIWKRSLKYVKRRVPLNFIMSLILILQILTVIIASLTISRPTITPPNSDETIIIVDASASMMTKEGDKTRFDIAKEKLIEATNAIGNNSRVSIIVAGQEAKFVLDRVADKSLAITAIKDIVCSTGSADLDGALEIVGTILEDNKGAKIKLYTDKEYLDTDGVEIVNCTQETEWNAGVISVEDQLLVAGYRYDARVVNFGSNAKCTIRLFVDGDQKASGELDLIAGETLQVVFSPNRSTKLEEGQKLIWVSDEISEYTEAKVVLNVEDGLAEDNSFTLYSKEEPKPKIMFVSTKVKYNEGKATCNSSLLLNALGAGGHVVRSESMFDSVDRVEEFSGYDLYIFENVVPPTLPTDGAVWILNPPKEINELQGLSVIIDHESARNAAEEDNKNGYPFKHSMDSSPYVSALTQKVDFETPMVFGQLEIKAAISKYAPITFYGDTFSPVYNCNGSAAMIVGTQGKVRTIVTSFDFNDSNLQIFVADFPVLVKNMVRFSLPEAMPERTCPVGEKVVFNAPAGAVSMTYKFNGEIVDEFEDLQYEIIADKVGVYQIEVVYEDESVQVFSVTSHIPEDESFKIEIVNEEIDVPEPSIGAEVKPEPIEILPYLLAIFILLVIIEWGVYYRDEY